ncbi:unnamed protein product [Somion occarium]
MRVHLWSSLFVLLFVSLSYSQDSSTVPVRIPLAIRSPYYNAWVDSTASGHTWPFFWAGGTLGWQGLIRVDKQVYQWLGFSGLNPPVANLTNTQLTPTQTVISMQAGPMDINATFLSPIETADALKQSIPLSYLSLEAKSRDGVPHSVQVYCDISGEFVTPDTNAILTWSSSTTGSSSFHQIQLQINQSLVDTNNRAHDLTMVIATQSNPEVSSRIANDTECRGQFSDDGILGGTPPTTSAKMGNPYPVFSISRDLGNITQTSSPMVWAIGGFRDPAISFTTSTGKVQQRSPLFASSYSDISSVVDAFVVDFADAKARADKLDIQILDAASDISPTYSSIISFATRQAIGGTELTIGMGSDNKWNMSDVKMFMKDMGMSGRVNPVENVYAAFPFFLYINSTYAGYLLAPLLEYQDSPQYSQPYAARDIGQNYPIATGSNIPHSQGYEQSSNMLIMALAHARASGDGSLISQHYGLLKDWADYLTSFNVTPPDATTVDQERQSNTTNLAIKGIIGIKAMSEISKALNQVEDADRYANFASAFANTWLSVASSSDGQHLLASYGNSASWAQIYNSYPDRLLQTGVVDNQTYEAQTKYYQSLLSGTSSQFGLPLDSSTDITNTAWTFFTAATTTDSTVRDSLINPVWTHATKDTRPLVLQYKVDTSDPLPTNGASNPALGAVFAPLALSIPSQSIVVPPSSGASDSTSPTTHSSIVGPVVGGVVGGVVLIAFIVVGALFWRRRRRQQYAMYSDKVYLHSQPIDEPPVIIPYTDLTLSSTQLPSSDNGETQDSPLGTMARPSKAQEAGLTSAAYKPSPPASSSYSAAPSSSREPPTEVTSPTTNVSNSDVLGLRVEVENLRRVMQEIQADRIEAPPSYAD